MRTKIHTQLVTTRAPKGARTPWLKGRGTRWKLVKPFVVEIDGKTYIVPAGYIFNGSSIPWWLWWMFPPTYAPAWEASCFHDYCYSHYWKNGITKAWADEAFHAIMLESGANEWIADRFYRAVSRFGKGGWQDGK